MTCCVWINSEAAVFLSDAVTCPDVPDSFISQTRTYNYSIFPGAFATETAPVSVKGCDYRPSPPRDNNFIYQNAAHLHDMQ